MLIRHTQLHYHSFPRLKRNMLACLCVNVLMENSVRTLQNFSVGWATKKSTRDNWISLNFSSVRTEFSKKSVYFSGDNPYDELPVQIHQLDSFAKFRNSINTFFDWDRRYWIIAFLIICSNDLKILRRREMFFNFSMDILHKSFFRWFGSVSLCSPFSANLYSYRLIFVWFLLLLRLFLNQKTMVRHTSVGIFLLWHISSVAYSCCYPLLIQVTSQLLCGLLVQHLNSIGILVVEHFSTWLCFKLSINAMTFLSSYEIVLPNNIWECYYASDAGCLHWPLFLYFYFHSCFILFYFILCLMFSCHLI